MQIKNRTAGKNAIEEALGAEQRASGNALQRLVEPLKLEATCRGPRSLRWLQSSNSTASRTPARMSCWLVFQPEATLPGAQILCFTLKTVGKKFAEECLQVQCDERLPPSLKKTFFSNQVT